MAKADAMTVTVKLADVEPVKALLGQFTDVVLQLRAWVAEEHRAEADQLLTKLLAVVRTEP